MRLINAICFLLLATNSHAAFWNKKDKQNGQRRRLTESPTNVVDVDAATGTVRNVLTPAQQEAAKAAQSCDGQMAQSLVKANEEMLEARADLGDLQKENDAALHLIQDLQGSLAKAEEVEKELTAKIDQTEQIKDKKIQSLTESLKMSQEEIVTEYEGQLAKAEERHAEQVQALNAKLDNAKEDYLADIRAMEAKDLAATEDVERSLQIALEGAQQKHNGEVESLKQQLETQAQEAEATLHTYKDEAKAFMLAQVEAREDKIEAAKGQANNAENALKGQHEELELWRSTFANRTYCNLTYVGEDIAWAGQQAYEKGSELSSNAYEASVHFATVVAKVVQEKSTLAWKETKKYSKQASGESKKFYNTQVKPQYEKHAQPLVNKHVMPLVAKASAFVDKEVTPKIKQVEAKIQPKYEQFKMASKKQFNASAKNYGVVCKKTYKVAKDFANNHDIDIFDAKIAPQWEYSCQNPKESLKAALIGVFVIVMLPFAFSILRLVFGVIYLFWRIFVAITPLRFFIGKSTKAKAPSDGDTGDVRVKKKKKARLAQ